MAHLIGIQFDIAWENRDENHRRVRAMLERQSPAPGALVALPEMFASGFSMNVAGIAEDENRVTDRFVVDLARQFGVFVVAGVVTRASDGRGRNEAIVISPTGESIGRYCKLHPYSPGKEKQHYCAGEEIITFKWNDFTVAPLICYDLRFPEAFRRATKRGANLMIVIASWPSPRVEHWVTLLRARAIENQAYVLGVNRCGTDPNFSYPGRSMIVDYRGEVLADAGNSNRIISAGVDAAAQAKYRADLPFLQDMRDDL